MNEIEWFFPERIEEVIEILKKDKVVPHSGGTGILRSDFRRIKGLIDLSLLSLDYLRNNNGIVEIGAMNTYYRVVQKLSQIAPNNVLIKSLSDSASTPLRNRITIGGSVAYFPIWSDLMGPLIALEAGLSLIGEYKGDYPVLEYVRNRELRNKTLITGIRFKPDNWDSYYYRATRTETDYARFNITILLKKSNNRIENVRIVMIGNKERFKRFTALEEYLKGKNIDRVKIQEIGKNLEVSFAGKKMGSPEYVKHLAGVELERGLSRVLAIS